VPPDEEGLTAKPPAGLSPRLRTTLFVALLLQVGILVYQHFVFLGQLFERSPRFGETGGAAAGSSLLLCAAIAGVSALWSRCAVGSPFQRLGQAGLVHLGVLGLVHYGVALGAARLVPWVSWAVLGVSTAAALSWRALSRASRPPSGAGFLSPARTRWDAVSGLFLATLLVPSVFPYIHYDAMTIWACKARGFAAAGAGSGSFWQAVTPCLKPNYPPLFSILLALGVNDPLFEGRLLPWLLLVFFVLFARERFARVAPSLAAPATLFLLATVQVWQGSAMYYANVALMAFLSAGALLVLDPGSGRVPSRGDVLAGTILLSAAVLTRPDGLYYLAAIAAAAAWSAWKDRTRFPILPLALALLAWASWGLRPPWVKQLGSFLSYRSGGWKSLAATEVSSFFAVTLEFLDGWQGQWLSHKGLGILIYLLVFAAVWDARQRAAAGEERSADKRLYGTVTLLSLAAVVFCYAVFPFVSDPVRELEPSEFTEYRAAYMNFIRVGLGRMTIHLYPFMVLWVLTVFNRGQRTP
jgi:hypothetical protein